MITRNLLIFGFFIIALILAQFANAQTVDEIIDKYIGARGGKDKLKAIRSIYMEGSRQMMGNEVAVKITKVQGKLSRTEFEMGGTNGFFLITDKTAWNYFPMRSPKPEPVPEDRLKTLRGELDIAGPLVDYTLKGHKAELIGKEDVEGIPCYKIKVTLSNGTESNYFIDTKSYLLNRITHNGGLFGGNRGKGDAEISTDYSDYKEVEGILFAHTLTIRPSSGSANSQAAGGTTFDKIELNKPVDEKLYKPE